MSNLYKQIKGEWVQLNEKQVENLWSGKRGSVIDMVKAQMHRFARP